MFFGYMVVSRRQGTIYTGHTDDLSQRVWEHKEEGFEGFSKDHDCKNLVWYELHETRNSAFVRERRIKEWKRCWKIELLEILNPHWLDLYPKLTHENIYDERRLYREPNLDDDGPDAN